MKIHILIKIDFWRSLLVNITIEENDIVYYNQVKVYTTIKSNYGRYNRFV